MTSPASQGLAAEERRRDRRVAIIQSNYVPWKGYFDVLARVDEFVLLDDAQFTKRDWRNRNKIKTPHGLHWLSVPVKTKGRFTQAIDETEIAEPWADAHWSTIAHNYARAARYAETAPALRALYEAVAQETMLSAVNRRLLEGVASLLGIATPIRSSREYGSAGRKTDRLLGICLAAGATEYLSGPAARDYLDVAQFEAAGIAVRWMEYGPYPEYPQPHGAFEHGVSIVDALLCTGSDARRYVAPSPSGPGSAAASG